MYGEARLAILLIVCFTPVLFAGTERIFHNLTAYSKGAYLNSVVPLRSQPDLSSGNVYQYRTPGGWTLLKPDWGNAYGAADVSAAGDVMAFTSARTVRQCTSNQSPSQCRGVLIVQSTLPTPAGRKQFDDYLQISRNGRYAFIGNENGQVLDLLNGEYRRVPGKVAAKRRALSDTGCAVTLPKGAVTLNCPSGERTFPVQATVRLAQVDAEAKRIVYQSALNPAPRVPLQFSFRAIDLATGQDSLISQEAIPADGISIVPELDQWSLTADGSRILYLAGEGSPVSSLQLFTIATGGAGRRQLTNPEEYPDGFWEAALSPDGSVAYGISADNRVVRIDMRSGDMVDIVPRTPLPIWVTLVDGLVPGSRATMIGSTLTGKPSPPQANAHVVLKLNGAEVPILEAKPESITFQVPFETLPGEARLEVIHASPFHLELPAIKVLPWRVEFLLPGGRGPAIHQDFRSLVTDVDPAVPGEIVHFYITGLGAVDPPVQTGAASPTVTLVASAGSAPMRSVDIKLRLQRN